MKKILATAALLSLLGTVAAARQPRPTDEEVNQVIDARLHALLVKLSASAKEVK